MKSLKSEFIGWIVVFVTCTMWMQVSAITINMTYTDEGSPLPHPENPSWDPDGTILKAHFQAAKAIWESLLPGPGSYEFDFHWDDDIGATTLGLTTDNAFDTFIEINPIQPWYADPTPLDSVEFSFSDFVNTMGVPVYHQRFYSQLSSSDQSTYFPGSAPPGALEVMYRGFGSSSFPSASGQAGVNASTGYDLLSTIVHEMGHVLGIAGIEPGEYNIFPQHVGGITNVLVLEGDGGHLAGNATVPGFLMCDSCGSLGVRRIPTASDVLVIAEDQGITNVHLARVGSISTGLWSAPLNWIGGDVPDLTQDVYVGHSGAVTLDANGQGKNISISGGSSVAEQTNELLGGGTLSINSAAITVGAGGSIEADSIIADPSSLTTTAGSLVRFNQFSRSTSSATTASFNGSVAIGFNSSSLGPVSFNANPLSSWTIGEHLAVGGPNQNTLVLNTATWNVGGNLTVGPSALSSGAGNIHVQSSGMMTVNGNVEVHGTLTSASEITVETGNLDIAGSVTIGGAGYVTYRGSFPARAASYTVLAGGTSVEGSPPAIPYHFKYSPAGRLTLDGTYLFTTDVNVEGGFGNGAAGGLVLFQGAAHADDSIFQVKAGRKGSFSPFLPLEIAGNGGLIRFEDNANADTAHFNNFGVSEYQGAVGSGGSTQFFDNSQANQATFHNYGATYNANAPGGRTEFHDNTTAVRSGFTNHPGWGLTPAGMVNPNGGAGLTIFRGNSTAASGTFTNKGGHAPSALYYGGGTWFFDNSTAGHHGNPIDNATFINEGSTGLPQGPPYAGSTRFYGNSNAGTATFLSKPGGGTTEFNDNSSAADGTFIVQTGGPGISGGFVVFNGNSKGGTANIIIQPFTYNATVAFGNSNTSLIDSADAENAEITLQDNSNAFLYFVDNATASQANIDIGSFGRLIFGGYTIGGSIATAGASTIRVRPVGTASFGVGSTASNAQITVEGAHLAGGGWGTISFANSAANNAVITIEGGTVSGARGGNAEFDFNTNIGNATLVAGSPTVAGATGGVILFRRGANGPNSNVNVQTGAWLDLTGNGAYGGTDIGSLEGGGTVILSGSELRTGSLNASTIISGPLVDLPGFNPNGRLTKVGTGTLTLGGNNTYTGLTKVNAGTLAVNGTVAGNVEVNSGGTLKGVGSIGGTVTVNASGMLAPGASPGSLTVGGLTLSPMSTLIMELAGSSPGSGYDQIISSGVFTLSGTLQVNLLNSFAPASGQSFNLFDWGNVSGSFNTLSLPTLTGGLSWSTSQLYTAGILSVVTGLAGDFDFDGDVDGRDFLVWQRNPGVGNLADWQANYGVPFSATSIAVPEPGTLFLLSSVVVVFSIRRPFTNWKYV